MSSFLADSLNDHLYAIHSFAFTSLPEPGTAIYDTALTHAGVAYSCLDGWMSYLALGPRTIRMETSRYAFTILGSALGYPRWHAACRIMSHWA
jgi:hypothetical protein